MQVHPSVRIIGVSVKISRSPSGHIQNPLFKGGHKGQSRNSLVWENQVLSEDGFALFWGHMQCLRWETGPQERSEKDHSLSVFMLQEFPSALWWAHIELAWQRGILASPFPLPSKDTVTLHNKIWLSYLNMPMACSANPENRQILVKDEKVKHGSYPCVVCCCRKKCLLFNDMVLIIATLNTGFSRRAKSFEMILIGGFLEGFSAGRTLHYSMLMWLLWGGYRNLPAGSTKACTVTPVEQGKGKMSCLLPSRGLAEREIWWIS